MSGFTRNGLSRRTLVKCLSVLATLSLRSGPGFARVSVDAMIALRNPVVASITDLYQLEGGIEIEAWFDANNKKRLVYGLLLDLDRLAGTRSNNSDCIETTNSSKQHRYAAFVTHCPHESCRVQLKTDPIDHPDLIASGHCIAGPLFLCPCHFSVFNPLREGEKLSGPAHRGLYRFNLNVQGDTITITHVEAAVVSLFK